MTDQNNHATAAQPLVRGWGSPLDPADRQTGEASGLPWLSSDGPTQATARRPAADPTTGPGAVPGPAPASASASPDDPTGPPPTRPAGEAPPTGAGAQHSGTARPSGLRVAPDPGEAPAWGTDAGTLSNAVRARRTPPRQGWRAALYRLTGWNPGLSEAEVRRADQLQRIRTPLPGPHSIVVGSIKGGIGKTTVSALLGLALAEHRGDRVIAVDANPDAGTLGDRLVGETLASTTTVRALLDDLDQIRSFTDLSRYTHLAGSLQVLTSEQEPEVAEAFSHTDYEAVLRLLSQYFPAIITDSGTGVVHSAMQGSLEHADSLVIVGALTQDGASRAARTLNYLATRDYPQLARDAVVVLSRDRHSADIDEDLIRQHFQARCRAVIEMPSDPHLATGGEIDLAALRPGTHDAVLELAATVAEGFHGRRTSGLASHGFRAATQP